MVSNSPKAQTSASVTVRGDRVDARLEDRRDDALRAFGELTEEQSRQLAIDAWTIGLRALMNAFAQGRESRLQDIGRSLLEDIDQQLKRHVESQQETIAAVLMRFFDPADGQVTQRLSAFVDDDGVLARLLERYLGPQNSVLAEALARQVGESSPLFRKLSPSDSEGLTKTLEEKLREVMNDEHSEFVRALDPLAEDGAVARFLRSLREDLRSADENRAEKLSTALAALDVNDESSLINRLARETEEARQSLILAVNPDLPSSPMAIMKQTLMGLLKEYGELQTKALRQQEERQVRFEQEVREALVRLEEKRAWSRTSPRGGLDFEEAVVGFVTAAVQGAPCVLEATGNSPGLRAKCKKGDLVLQFTEESAYKGAAIVFEAKRDGSFTAQRALAELDIARANRAACAGVFVMAKSHVPDGFPLFARFGSNVLVVWDDEDQSTDPYLHAAILLGLGLAVRSQRSGDEGDLGALRDLEGRIEDELQRLGKMEKYNQSIRRGSEGLADEIRKAQHALDILLRKGRSVVASLQIELHDEALERGSPVALAPASFQNAARALLPSSITSAAERDESGLVETERTS